MPKSEGEGGAGRAGEEGDKISPAAGRKERSLELAEPKYVVIGREGAAGIWRRPLGTVGVSDGTKGLLSGEQTAGRRGLCVMAAFYIHLRLVIQFIPS